MEEGTQLQPRTEKKSKKGLIVIIIITILFLGFLIGAYFMLGLNKPNLEEALDKTDPTTGKNTMQLIANSDTQGKQRAGVTEKETELIIELIEKGDIEGLINSGATIEEVVLVYESGLVDKEKADKAMQEEVKKTIKETEEKLKKQMEEDMGWEAGETKTAEEAEETKQGCLTIGLSINEANSETNTIVVERDQGLGDLSKIRVLVNNIRIKDVEASNLDKGETMTISLETLNLGDDVKIAAVIEGDILCDLADTKIAEETEWETGETTYAIQPKCYQNCSFILRYSKGKDKGNIIITGYNLPTGEAENDILPGAYENRANYVVANKTIEKQGIYEEDIIGRLDAQKCNYMGFEFEKGGITTIMCSFF